MVRLICVLVLISFISCNSYNFPAAQNRSELLIKKFNAKYKDVTKDVRYDNLQMLGDVNKIGVTGQRTYGMILRVLRFKKITDAVEAKYKLPENLLLAMIMQESGDVDLLPNSSDDGGIGLIHMQPSVANQFGLKTYKNCNKLRCKKHGKELRQLIIKNDQDRKKLVKIDDRFHPIINIDAAARMLLYYRSGPQTKGNPLKTAIYGYAGKYNYKKYYNNVVLYMKKLKDKRLLRDIEQAFNQKNKKLKINGKKADFKDYIRAHHQQNLNYGLKEYVSE